MARTTVNIDDSVLDALRRLQRRKHQPLGPLISQLLAKALADDDGDANRPLRWISKPMTPVVDLEDKDAVHRILDAS